MNFMLKGYLRDKFYDIFEDIREKSNIDHIDYVYESPAGIEYLKTNASEETLV